PSSRSYAPPRLVNARPIDLLASRIGPPTLDVVRILVGARRDPEDDAALLDALLVDLRALLGDAVPDQRTDQRADRSTRTTSRHRRGERAHRDDGHERNGDARRGEPDEERAEAGARCRPDPRTLGRLRAELRLRDRIPREAAR